MSYIAGKQAFLEILKQEGVSLMFGDPGTTELPQMGGLARQPAIRYVRTWSTSASTRRSNESRRSNGGHFRDVSRNGTM